MKTNPRYKKVYFSGVLFWAFKGHVLKGHATLADVFDLAEFCKMGPEYGKSRVLRCESPILSLLHFHEFTFLPLKMAAQIRDTHSITQRGVLAMVQLFREDRLSFSNHFNTRLDGNDKGDFGGYKVGIKWV
jgi:hypothetical protein